MYKDNVFKDVGVHSLIVFNYLSQNIVHSFELLCFPLPLYILWLYCWSNFKLGAGFLSLFCFFYSFCVAETWWSSYCSTLGDLEPTSGSNSWSLVEVDLLFEVVESSFIRDRESESFRTSEIILPEGTSLQSAKLLGLRSKSYNFVLSFHRNNRYNCWLCKQVYCKYIIVQAVEVKFNKEEGRGKRIMCNFKSKFLQYLWVFLISSRKKNMQAQIRKFVMSALSRVV